MKLIGTFSSHKHNSKRTGNQAIYQTLYIVKYWLD